ncbi:transposase [Rossellomorea marisflavi]|uniref:phBC6A51 family helix-turn-helix protein n=1 Tax=Rossellomorea marisflavi TaxID=189381 RepID=UPI001318864E|nr:phBC6A51 family helix-turn-helix protein [Rossellomorea marisflavi]QHA36864.1 transposase [Rossellomorea marisflavi]
MTLKQLGPDHYAAIAMLALPKRGGKTYEEIAEELGVHVNTLYNWRRDELFQREYKREIVRASADRLPEIFAAIPAHIIKDGNAALFKTLLQANDMLTDRVEVSHNSEESKDIDAIKARLAEFRKRSESTSD